MFMNDGRSRFDCECETPCRISTRSNAKLSCGENEVHLCYPIRSAFDGLDAILSDLPSVLQNVDGKLRSFLLVPISRLRPSSNHRSLRWITMLRRYTRVAGWALLFPKKLNGLFQSIHDTASAKVDVSRAYPQLLSGIIDR